MSMAAPHCIAFVNPKCANDAKQKKRVRTACVLNRKQNSAVYGAAAHTSGGQHVARQGQGGTRYGNHKQSGGTTFELI